MNNNLYCRKYNNIQDGIFFIPSDDICFYVEKIPDDIGYFGAMSYKDCISRSINGYVLKKFHIFEHFICLYTKQRPLHKNTSIVLLQLIEIFKKVLKLKIFAEIWIIKDMNFYQCIGLYYDAPIFYKTFQSICDVNINLSIMIDSINQYINLDVIRFFNCNYNDFDSVSCAVFEYTENWFKEFICGYLDLDSYCRAFVLNKLTSKNWFKLYIGANIILNIFSSYLYYKSIKFLKQEQQIISEINFISKQLKSFPPKNHVNYIKNLLN